MPDFIGPGGGCLVGWGLFAMCGFFRRTIVIKGPLPPIPDPDPPDTLGWLVGLAVAILGGVVVGYYFHQVFAIDHADSAGILLTFIGAFVGGRIATDVVGRAMPRFASR